MSVSTITAFLREPYSRYIPSTVSSTHGNRSIRAVLNSSSDSSCVTWAPIVYQHTPFTSNLHSRWSTPRIIATTAESGGPAIGDLIWWVTLISTYERALLKANALKYLFWYLTCHAVRTKLSRRGDTMDRYTTSAPEHDQWVNSGQVKLRQS